MTISWAAHPAASLVKLFGVALHLQTLARSRSTSLSAEYEYGLPVTIGVVALNCVGNGCILREGPFEKIWVQPAAGDAGGAIGAALLALASLQRQAALSDWRTRRATRIVPTPNL